MANSRICSIHTCDKPAFARGWCEKHYYRWLRRGDPLAETPKERIRSELDRAIQYAGDDCLVWPLYRDPSGRGQIHYNGRNAFVARVICEEAYGPPPTQQYVAAHSCGNGHLGCCNPHHLRWATQSENLLDTHQHGTVLTGARNPQAKLDQASVDAIRELSGTLSQRNIARQFGVSQALISHIVRRKVWV